MLSLRQLEESDYPGIITVLDAWWDERHMTDMLPRLFFKHFNRTGFVIETGGTLVAFLIGFISQTRPSHAYIHFMGVHPEHRRSGLGTRLHKAFFDRVKPRGCDTVHLVTSPQNKKSIAFHSRIGYRIEEGDRTVEGVPVHSGYDGPGEDRVLFTKEI